MPTTALVLVLGAGTALGLIAERLRVPGGLILGSMVGAAVVTMVSGRSGSVPIWLRTGALIIIGTSIGVLLSRDTVRAMTAVLVPAVMSGVLIIAAGVAIAYLLRALGMAPPADVLATSPGALSVMSAIAVEQGTGTVEVAIFHLVRVVLVILALPALASLMR